MSEPRPETPAFDPRDFARFLDRIAGLDRVFLVGHGKSGTTWAARMLAAHPATLVKGERKLVERNGRYEPLLAPFVTGEHVAAWHGFSSMRLSDIGEETGFDIARLAWDYLLYRTGVPARATGGPGGRHGTHRWRKPDRGPGEQKGDSGGSSGSDDFGDRRYPVTADRFGSQGLHGS